MPAERVRRRAAVVAAAILVVAGAATGCGAGTSDSTESVTTTTAPMAPALAPRPHPFTRVTVPIVDPTRPTEAGSQTPALPTRTLSTTLYVPAGPGPFPLIAFAHGISGHPDKLSELFSSWAAAGYVVVAPAFPVTNERVPGSDANWRNVAAQPADISFLLDTVLGTGGDHDAVRQIEAQLPPDDAGTSLPDRIDPDRVGVGGLSLGGGTAYGVAFNTCCRDPRVKAVEVLSGAQFPVGVPDPGQFVMDGHVPLLIMHGDHDPTLPYHLATDIYAAAAPPVWLVTLVGANHAPAYENDPSPWDGVATEVTTAFWDATIGGDPLAMGRMEADAVVPGLSTLQKKVG